MGTRTLAQVAPTSGEIALNAYIFGYGGHSLVTPHAALKQLWWTDERIERKVTRAFVLSKLRGEERDFLDQPLAFGEGLTDDTYMEWILERARRLFLILTAVGVPDQIFGCIDDSWDDDDLPIPLDNVRSLELSYRNDDVLNKKFYETQFVYLLRELKQGAHIDYGPSEHIPMEHVNSLPPAVMLQAWDRIHFPGREEKIFMRRKFPLAEREGSNSCRDAFLRDTKQAQAFQHEHIAATWATYTSENAGYVLSDFVGEHTLGTFIDHRMPTQLLKVSARERPILLCEWMHCLADALASLHHRGTAHTAIRPSNILVDKDNHIAFADVGCIRTYQHGKKPKKNEAYDYAAPESSLSRAEPVSLASSPPPSSVAAFSRLRKISSMSSSTSSSGSSAASSGSSVRRSSFGSAFGSTATPPSPGRTNSLKSVGSAVSPLRSSSTSLRNFSRLISPPSLPTTPMSASCLFPTPTMPNPDNLCDLPRASPPMSDIWSLACIYLDLLTFILKGRTTEFMKHRSTLVTVSQGSGRSKRRTDTSFHADPDKLDEWMTILKEESDRRLEPIYRGIPELLRLVRRMLSQNALLRPTAVEVRDRILDILLNDSGVETLCCAGREWPETSPEIFVSPPTRDSVSIAAGLVTQSRRQGSFAALRSGSTCGSETLSVFSRSETNITTSATAARTGSRRGSAASTMTARFRPWKRAFTRSH